MDRIIKMIKCFEWRGDSYSFGFLDKFAMKIESLEDNH